MSFQTRKTFVHLRNTFICGWTNPLRTSSSFYYLYLTRKLRWIHIWSVIESQDIWSIGLKQHWAMKQCWGIEITANVLQRLLADSTAVWNFLCSAHLLKLRVEDSATERQHEPPTDHFLIFTVTLNWSLYSVLENRNIKTHEVAFDAKVLKCLLYAF